MQNAILTIDGMDGEACADKVEQVLSEIDGVSDVRVSLRDSRASVQIDEALTSPSLLTQSLSRAGYPTSATDGTPDKAASGCCGGCCGGR